MTDDNGLVRQTASQLETSAKWARCFGLALIAIGVLVWVVGTAITVYVALEVRDIAEAEAKRQQKQVEADAFADQLILCILEQFAEHRAASIRHSQQQAALHNDQYVGENPELDPTRLSKLCDPVVNALQNGGIPPKRDDPAHPLPTRGK